MLDCIASILESLLRLLLPAPGRHRAPTPTPADASPTMRQSHAPQAPARMLCTESPEDPDPGVRPYMLTPEECRERWERAEHRLQRERRRALWLASHGLDVGPRWIHGAKVAAR